MGGGGGEFDSGREILEEIPKTIPVYRSLLLGCG